VEGIDMTEVEGMDMVKNQDHPMNYRLREKDMNMVDSHMVEVEGYFHPMNHRSEVEDMDMVEEYFHPMNH
jgi:hypothetical protein